MILLAFKSMLERRLVVFLCILSIALSSALYLGVTRLKDGAREGFTNTLSGADLIVGAKGGPLNLLLYSVFHLGTPINNIRYDSYLKWSENPRIKWTIPISLGDSYRGFRVVGTNENFINHYQYLGDRKIELKEGRFASGIWGVALGSQVAKDLAHKLGDPIILSHGIGSAGILNHDHTPFKVEGILKATGTPIDRSVFITLQGMEAMHIGWETGIPNPDKMADVHNLKFEDIEIHQITSFIAGAKNRIQVLHLRRAIDDDRSEPLMAIIPGLALAELWQILGSAEVVLQIIALCVLVVAVLGIVISLTTSLQMRRREMAILRSVGGAPRHIVFLLLSEAATIAFCGFILGQIILLSTLGLGASIIEKKYHIALALKFTDLNDLYFLALTLTTSLLMSLIPAIMAYRLSLKDGLTNGV